MSPFICYIKCALCCTVGWKTLPLHIRLHALLQSSAGVLAHQVGHRNQNVGLNGQTQPQSVDFLQSNPCMDDLTKSQTMIPIPTVKPNIRDLIFSVAKPNLDKCFTVAKPNKSARILQQPNVQKQSRVCLSQINPHFLG
jgi:hypothetical protein